MWTMIDLFSGIGGFSLAASWVWQEQLDIKFFCECDKFCQKVLHNHWPDVPIIEDVRNVKANTIIAYNEKPLDRCNIRGKGEGQIQELGKRTLAGIDLLTGGFPCQPFSVAGKRKGKEDNRFLWPEMFRVIKEIRPRWVVAENVAGIVRMELDNCLSDLEGEGYSTQAVIIPACAVNAPHRRDRVWIVAYCKQSGLEGQESESKFSGKQQRCLAECNWWSTEPDVGRVAHGVPSRVDRLKSLGNAIVPQVAAEIFRAIKEVEEHKED